MELEPDWDLHAVVRGFAAINKQTTSSTNFNSSNNSESVSTADVVSFSSARDEKQAKEDKGRHVECYTNLAVAQDLHDLYTPYLFSPAQTGSGQLQPTVSSYLAALDATKHPTQTHQQHKGRQLLGTISASALTSRTTTSSASVGLHSQTPHKPKRRKNQLKKVCHVPAESLSSDIWSWRKYGQKPIKGSPYPRGYYKCSSSKACLARKQVERNRSDPNMFIVTYTADHNHPAPTHKNSLAGTTRHPNPISSSTSTAHDESNLPTCKPSSSSSMATMSPAGSLDDGVLQQSNGTERKAVDSKGDIRKTNLVDDVLGFLDMDVTDDFFDGLDEIAGTPSDCYLPDQILPSFPV